MIRNQVTMSDYNADDDVRVLDWENGLPTGDDLPSLSHILISPDLALAFTIPFEPSRTPGDVNRASENTLSSLLRKGINNSPSFAETVVDLAEEELIGSDFKKSRRIDEDEDGGGACGSIAEEAESDPSGRSSKRPRLVWTPQLHKRFVDVVGHLGIEKAVPKTIMQLMNVDGLTRENVASHLQKYRLYLKRMQDGPSPSPSTTAADHIFSSVPPPPQSLNENGGGGAVARGNGLMELPLPFSFGGNMLAGSGLEHAGYRRGDGFNLNPYMLQPVDWSRNKYGSVYLPVGNGGGRSDK